MAKQTSTKTSAAPEVPAVVNPELPYPQIEYAENNNVLDPIKAIKGTRAIITVANMQAAPVTLYWAIKDQALPAFEPIVVPGSTSGSVEIAIPWQWVSTCIGHTVLVKYSATVNGRLQESLVLELEIQQIREENLRESLPVFLHSRLEWSTWWLNMYEFQGDETIRIKAWPMIQAGQRLFVTVAGNQHQVPYRFIWVAFDHVVTAAQAHVDHVFEFRLSRGWMSRLDDYSALTIHMGVIWDGTAPVLPAPDDPVHENPLPINAQDFHLRTTTLLWVDPALDLPPPHLLESTECEPNRWVVNPINTLNGAHLVVEYDMHPGDVVCPVFLGTPGPGSPAIECRVVQEGDSRLEFRVQPSSISANFKQMVNLSYTVSYGEYEPFYSPDRIVDVLDIDLPRPEVWEATGNVLDLNTFSGHATGMEIPWHYIAAGQLCWMWVTGTREDGSVYSFEVLKAAPVTPEWLTSGVNTPLPREELQKMADCEPFNLHFAVSFNGDSIRENAKKSPVRTIDLIQENLVLKAPTVLEAVGSQLTVWNGRDGVTVRAAYERIGPHHTISMCWRQPDGSCLPLESKPGNSDPGYVDFSVPRDAVIRGNCKTVPIDFTVTSKCKLVKAPALQLEISKPVRLPAPVVPEATPPATNGGVLDLRTFSGNPSITVEKWWFILPGQYVWLKGEGIQKDGRSYTLNVYQGKVVTTEEVETGLKDILARSELELLQDGSELVFTCAVMQGKDYDEHCAVVFPVLNLIVRAITVITEDFSGVPSGQHDAGVVVQTPTMSIVARSGAVGIHAANPPAPGMTAGNAIALNCKASTENEMPRQQIDINLNSSHSRVVFSYTRHAYYGQFVFYNSAGTNLGTITFSQGGSANKWIDFTPPDGERVVKIVVYNSQHSYLDNFTMYS